MENWTLHAAKTYVISELEAAEQSELQALRHLRNAGEEWIRIKEELGDRGLNIADWCKAHMPVSCQWLDRHAEPAKGWRKFLSARKWANDVGYTSRRESGLDYALELMAVKHSSDIISSASTLAHGPDPERHSSVVTALSRVRILTGDALKMLRTYEAEGRRARPSMPSLPPFGVPVTFRRRICGDRSGHWGGRRAGVRISGRWHQRPGWSEFAHREHVRRDDSAEAQAEPGRDGEQSSFVSRQQESDHRRDLAGGAGEDRPGAADPVGQEAPELAADERAAEQHGKHRCAFRRGDPHFAAKRGTSSTGGRERNSSASRCVATSRPV